MRGQDDGDAAFAQCAHHAPHFAPQFHVHPRGGLVQEQEGGSWASALAISTRRFMLPDSVMILLSFFSHSDRSRSTFSICAGLARLPNRPRLKLTVAQTDSNASVVSSCGTSPIFDRAARYSVTMSCPSASTRPALGRTRPQMMLISVVLPAPFGPSRAKISPRLMARLMSDSACKPLA